MAASTAVREGFWEEGSHQNLSIAGSALEDQEADENAS